MENLSISYQTVLVPRWWCGASSHTNDLKQDAKTLKHSSIYNCIRIQIVSEQYLTISPSQDYVAKKNIASKKEDIFSNRFKKLVPRKMIWRMVLFSQEQTPSTIHTQAFVQEQK